MSRNEPHKHSEVLTELEQVLDEQLALARKENYEAMDDLGEKLGNLLARAGDLAKPLPQDCREQLERIKQMHQRLLLTLNDSRKATADKLRQTQTGGRTLRAYRDSGGSQL